MQRAASRDKVPCACPTLLAINIAAQFSSFRTDWHAMDIDVLNCEEFEVWQDVDDVPTENLGAVSPEQAGQGARVALNDVSTYFHERQYKDVRCSLAEKGQGTAECQPHAC